MISHSREHKAIDNKSNHPSHQDCACQCLPLLSPRAALPGSEAAGLWQPKQLPRRWPLVNHTLLLPSAPHPAPVPHKSHGLHAAQQEGVNTSDPDWLRLLGNPREQERDSRRELCRRALDRYKSIGTPKDTNKSTKPKAALTAVNLPNGRDSSRKTIFPSAVQLLCSFNYPREFTEGFLSSSLFISHIFCLFPKTDLITPTCTWPDLTHWEEGKGLC